jgi:hypothetical protein
LIDPQLQGILWLRNKFKEDFSVIRFGQKR